MESRKIISNTFQLTPENQQWLDSLPRPVYSVSIAGLGRAGKSELLNKLLSLFVGRQESVFRTSDETLHCTEGVDAVAIPYLGGTLLLLDCEGIDNGPSRNHPKVLAVSSQLSTVLCYVEEANFNQRAINSVADMIAQAKITLGGQARWPHLCMVINKMTLRIPQNLTPDQFYAQRLADDPHDEGNNLDRQAIRGLPQGGFYPLPLCSENDRNNANSAYGVVLARLYNAIRRLVQPIDLHINGQSCTLGEYFRHVIDTVRNSANMQRVSRFQMLVDAACERVKAQCHQEYDTAMAPIPLDGRTPDNDILQHHRLHTQRALSDYDTQTAHWEEAGIVMNRRRELVQELNDKLQAKLTANALQRGVVEVSTETQTIDSDPIERTRVGEDRRTVYFHDDVTVKYHVFALRAVYARTIQVLRNGDRITSNWERQGEPAKFFVREETENYTEESGLGKVAKVVVSAVGTGALTALTGGTFPLVLAAGVAAGATAAQTGTVGINTGPIPFGGGNSQPNPPQPSAPNTNLGLNTPQTVPLSGFGLPNLTQPATYTDAEARDVFRNSGIGWNHPEPRTSFGGIRSQTVNEVLQLRNLVDQNVPIIITGGTERQVHSQAHHNGYKVDIRVNNQLDNYIQSNFTRIADRTSDHAPQYQRGNVIYAREGDHWDVLVP